MNGDGFQLEAEDLGERVRVLKLRGELDLADSPSLRDRFAEAMQQDRDLILADLSDVTMIDSTTLSVLLNAHRRLTRRGGALALATTNDSIKRVLEVTLLDRTFDIHQSRDDALAALRQLGA